MNAEQIELKDNTLRHHLELEVAGYTSFIDYKRTNEKLYLIHTEVPENLEGQGVGSAIVKKAFQYAEQNNLKVVPQCSFVQLFVKRHKEWERLVAED